MSYYIHFADHLLKAKGEEVFRRVVQEGVDAYINNWKRKEAAGWYSMKMCLPPMIKTLWWTVFSFPAERQPRKRRTS